MWTPFLLVCYLQGIDEPEKICRTYVPEYITATEDDCNYSLGIGYAFAQTQGYDIEGYYCHEWNLVKGEKL